MDIRTSEENKTMASGSNPRRGGALVVGLAVVAACVGCVSEPPPRVAAAPAPPPDTNVYFYPMRGQASDQQDRDKYECNNWAVQQSGFDPSAPGAPPHLRVQAIAGPPPGTGVAMGAATGAVLGAVVSDPWESGRGAVVGAIAGAVIGGIAESAAREQAGSEAAAAAGRANNAQAIRLEQQARDFRRAMSACLEGRGYSVR